MNTTLNRYMPKFEYLAIMLMTTICLVSNSCRNVEQSSSASIDSASSWKVITQDEHSSSARQTQKPTDAIFNPEGGPELPAQPAPASLMPAVRHKTSAVVAKPIPALKRYAVAHKPVPVATAAKAKRYVHDENTSSTFEEEEEEEEEIRSKISSTASRDVLIKENLDKTIIVNVKPTIEKKNNFYKVHIFYGTDRKRTGQNNTENFYGSERNKDAYEVGIIDVSVPITHKVGEIESAPWWHIWNQRDSTQYMLSLGITPMDNFSFLNKIRNVVNHSDERDAFVFVHGYNNTFNSAALRTAQLAFDIGFKGAAIMFSWPSKGEIFGYGADDNAVTKATPHLTDFLSKIISSSGATKLHVIAHSMGNRALTSALVSLKSRNPGVIFDQIILAAPDIDAELFREEIAPKILSVSKRITLYASSRDRALHMSHSVYKDVRLGEGGKNIFIAGGIESIDASDLECDDFFNHAYFVRARPVIDDITKLFYFNAPPSKRSLREQKMSTGSYWLFKK